VLDGDSGVLIGASAKEISSCSGEYGRDFVKQGSNLVVGELMDHVFMVANMDIF